MLKAYINYPNPHITVHSNVECRRIQQQQKQNQRLIRIDATTLAEELRRFETKYYQFGAHRDVNDMWCEIDFKDTSYEKKVIDNICELLARHYSPFRRVEIDNHC